MNEFLYSKRQVLHNQKISGVQTATLNLPGNGKTIAVKEQNINKAAKQQSGIRSRKETV
jgi:hypothetical protein